MSYFLSLLEYILFWIFIKLLKFFKFPTKIFLSSKVISFILRNSSKYRKRVFNNLKLIYPKMSDIEKKKFLYKFSKNLGLTFSEFLFNEEYHKYQQIKLQSYTQIMEILEAININRPVLIVSGHIGPWEAVRALLKRNGIETAAIYRKSSNIFYQPYHHKAIEAGGKPIFQVGRKGTTAMIKYLKQGGVVCMMIDQAVSEGKYINFMGYPAKTSFAIADIAIKYNALIVPAYAVRKVEKKIVEVSIEPSIPLSKPTIIMRQLNKSLENIVKKYPSQWYWVHNRWK
ncbi:MAG: lysophospholipid acyltransferase family protein [Paracoccaceae bacterium]